MYRARSDGFDETGARGDRGVGARPSARPMTTTAPRPQSSQIVIVDLDVDGTRTLFEFGPSEDRAFSVGASSNCDLSVRRAGTPAVAFYLERRHDAIWLVPAYRRSALRVNGLATLAPRRIARAAVVGFADVHALITVRALSGSNEACDPPTGLSASTRRSRLSYLAGLPDSEDRTLFDPPGEAGTPPPPSNASEAGERTSMIRATRPAANAARRAQIPTPHLWEVFGSRPYESLAFVLVIGLWITAVALAVVVLLRP